MEKSMLRCIITDHDRDRDTQIIIKIAYCAQSQISQTVIFKVN
jgi:hypothetical protein